MKVLGFSRQPSKGGNTNLLVSTILEGTGEKHSTEKVTSMMFRLLHVLIAVHAKGQPAMHPKRRHTKNLR